MKKWLAVLLSYTMLFSLAACGGDTSSGSSSAGGSSTPQSQVETPAYTVTENDMSNLKGAIAWVGGMAISSTSDKLQWRGFCEQLSTWGDYNVVDMGPAEFTQSAQIDKIEECIAQEVAAIVISPVTDSGVEEVLRKAIDAGIKVISFNGRAPVSVRTTHINQCNPNTFAQQSLATAVLQTLDQSVNIEQSELVETAKTAAAEYGDTVKIGVISTLPDAAIQSSWINALELAAEEYENGIEFDIKYTNNDVAQGAVLLDSYAMQGDVKSIVCLATNTVTTIAEEINQFGADIKLTGCMWATSAYDYMSGDEETDAIPLGFGWDFEWWGQVMAAAVAQTLNGEYTGAVGESIVVNPTATYPDGATIETAQATKESEVDGTEVFAQDPIAYNYDSIEMWVDQEASVQ